MPEEQYIVHSKQPATEPLPNCSVGQYVKQKIDELCPDKIVLIDANTDQKITKQQLDRQSNEIAAALIELGVESEDCAMFYGDDLIEYFVANLSTIYLGLVTSPSTPANGPYETGKQLANVNAKLLFISVSKLPVIRQMLDDDTINGPLLATLQLLVILDGDTLEDTEINELISHRNSPKNVMTFQKLLEIGSGKRLKQIPYFPVENPEQHPFTIVFTSGTTGLPKGAIQPHRSIIGAMEALQYSFAYNSYLRDSCLGMVYPFGHISGSVFMIACIKVGATVIMFSKYSDELYLESIERYRIEVVSMLPKFCTTLYDTDYTKLYDLSSMKLAIVAGCKYAENLIKNLKQRYRVAVNDIYGATEFLVGIANLDEDYPYGSVGSPVPNVQMKIVDLTSGDGLPSNQEGEICFRGPNCFIGYLNNEKATKETIDQGGWYHSGDVGYYDEKDRLYITDRIKELIKYKHWSIAPAEIEGFLQTHQAVFAACVVGVHHETEGNHLRAYVQLVEGQSVEESELVEFVKENMGYQKRLNGGVQFVDDIPRTIIGKVDRKYFKNLVKDEMLYELAQDD